ncbi:MAG TPA: carbohydrate binding family 9 domain-containing protein [Gemmatimonadaceae bacterium]|nr:carbohydrate binding family 9 domain-containing protein [Gemmatimonadaceae bacterium]
MLACLALCHALATTPYVGRDNQIHVHIPRVDTETTIHIDGLLDEPAWRGAAVLAGFSQFSPQDGVPAADSTQVLLWYSPTALYVGIRAFESHGAVHATLADRDKISADDNVQLLIGTFHDQRQAYVFAVNPLGVQMDGMLVENGFGARGSWTPTLAGRASADLSQDFVFESKGRLTAYGYEVEIRIPFKSLKYQSAAEQTWDLNVVREVQHSGYEDSWAPAVRANASFLAQSGTIEGLTGLDRGVVLDVNPVVTQHVNGAPALNGWGYHRESPQLGGTVRWGLTNTLTMTGTGHPDFAEVESDAGQFVIDPRRALFFPEKRPFFIEGLEAFSVPHTLIYTRDILQPDAALKLSGKMNGTTIGFLSAADNPGLSPDGRERAVYDVMRAQHDFGDQSRLGIAYTDRVLGGDYNRVADVDGRLAFSGAYNAIFQYAQSFDKTQNVVRNAPLWTGALVRNGKEYGFRYLLDGISDDFIARSGFISRAGVVHGLAEQRFTWFANRGSALEAITGLVNYDDTWEYSHFMRGRDAQDKKFHSSATAAFRGGWNVGLGVYWETFGWDSTLYANYRILSPAGDTLPFTGISRIFNRDYVLTLATPQWKVFNATLLYVGGQDENFYEWAQANIDLATLTVSMRPNDRVRLDASYQYQDFWRRSDGSLVARNVIPRLKVEYQLTRSIFLRVVGEYDLNETNDLRDETRTFYPLLIGGEPTLATRERTLRGDYLFSYTPRPGTVLYLGYGNTGTGLPDATQRFNFQPIQRTSDYFFFKYSYLFRV